MLEPNTIAENIPAQINEEGNQYLLFQGIVDHRYNRTEVKEQDAFITTHTRTNCRRETTKAVEVIIQCKYGIKTWVDLEDVKNYYSVQIAEYSVQFHIENNPVFLLWILNVLAKRNGIIGKMKSKYWVCKHTFGINIPKTVQEAKASDEENDDTFWWGGE